MFKRIAVLMILFSSHAVSAQDLMRSKTAVLNQDAPAADQEQKKRSLMTDAAVMAAVIAGSIAAYKAMGKPCACPSDTMKNGRACGGNSAYSRPGGFKPLCFPTDVTADIIATWRATGTIPRQ